MSIIENLKKKYGPTISEKKDIEEATLKEHELSAKSQIEKAREYYSTSSFPALLERLKKEVFEDLTIEERECKYKEGQFLGSDDVYEGEWDPKFSLRLKWKIQEKEDLFGRINLTYNQIDIDFLPIGEINIHAGIRGRKKLTKDNWTNNPGVQEKVLEKAFLHPVSHNDRTLKS